MMASTRTELDLTNIPTITSVLLTDKGRAMGHGIAGYPRGCHSWRLVGKVEAAPASCGLTGQPRLACGSSEPGSSPKAGSCQSVGRDSPSLEAEVNSCWVKDIGATHSQTPCLMPRV